MSLGFKFGTEIIEDVEVPVDFGDKWDVIVLDGWTPPSTTPGVGVAVPFPNGSTRFYRTTRDVTAIEFPVEYPKAHHAAIIAALTSATGLPLEFAGYTWTAIWDGGPMALIEYGDSIETTIRFLA